ncbi:DUF502 domain-containing protein [bacterium]|nr:DUF502 domain-containing protein [bacterium]
MSNNKLHDEKLGFWRSLRKNIVTGFLVLGPTVITIYVLWHGFMLLDGILGNGINFLLREVLGLPLIGANPVPGIGFIALLILLILTGFAARNAPGQWAIRRNRMLMIQIPMVNRVYRAIEQISQAIFSGKKEVFKSAVLIEYPRKGVYSIAIETADTSPHLQEKLPEDSITVFVPTTPNPTSGFLLFVPKRDVISLDISVEDALKLIISGGTITMLEEEVSRLTEQ